jgi:hypothetical protein
MAFPTIPTVAASRVLTNTQADSSGTRTFPSLTGLTKNSGDLLIAICVVYSSSAASGAVFSSWGGGFTEFTDQGGGGGVMSIGAAYKISTGSETGTFTVTQAATVTGHAAMFLLSIPNASRTLAPEASTFGSGTTSPANVPSLDPAAWGTVDTLWIAVGGSGETGTAGSFTGITGAPTNYTNYVETGISADVVGGVEAAVAFRQLNAGSEDPSAFTGVDVSNARSAALLLAVAPGPISVTITHAQDTNSAQQVSGSTLTRNITPATETDLVGEIVPLQPLPAAETQAVQPISTQSGHVITVATETDSTLAVDVDKKVTIALASETDVVPVSGYILSPASETDSAQSLSLSTYELTPVTETDSVGDIVEFQPLPAETTDTSRPLATSQSELSLTPATETAAAQVVSYTQGGGYVLALASETDLANTIVSLQPLPATSTESAQALGAIFGGKNIAPAIEVDSAQAIAPSAGINLPEWETSVPLPYNVQVAVGDVSTAVALSITGGIGPTRTIGPAEETDTAQSLTGQHQVTITLVTEATAVQAITRVKTLGVTTVSTTDLALGISFTQAGGVRYPIEPAISTDTARALSITKTVFMTLEIVSESDSARPARAANRPTGGLVLTDHDLTSDLALTDHPETGALTLIDI